MIAKTDTSLADDLNTFYARFEAASHCANGAVGANKNKDCMQAESTNAEKAFIITEGEVRRVFQRVNIRKAVGTDGISGRVLRACADQLAPVFTEIFNLSLDQLEISTCFKQSIIVPIPKKSQPSCLNDYRPALTSIVMKCFERLFRNFITSLLPDTIDSLQFAYRPNCSTDDAITHLLHTALDHLDKRRGNYVKMLFVDYSSAFNTIIPSKLTLNLKNLRFSLKRLSHRTRKALRYATHSFQWLAPREGGSLLRRTKRTRSGAHQRRACACAAVKVQNSSTFAAARCDASPRGQ